MGKNKIIIMKLFTKVNFQMIKELGMEKEKNMIIKMKGYYTKENF